MSGIANQLPTDVEALHALVTAVRAERDAAVAERDQALSRMDRLRHLLRRLQPRSSAGVRRSSIPSGRFSPSRTSSKPLPATRPPMTERTPWPHGRAATSAASIAVRFPLIYRASM